MLGVNSRDSAFFFFFLAESIPAAESDSWLMFVQRLRGVKVSPGERDVCPAGRPIINRSQGLVCDPTWALEVSTGDGKRGRAAAGSRSLCLLLHREEMFPAGILRDRT